MTVYSLVATVVVMIAIVVAILLFEKKRAKQIERDLGEMARERDEPRRPSGE